MPLRVPKKKDSNIHIQAYESVNQTTGEIEQRTRYDVPENYTVVKIKESPARAKENFIRINRIDKSILTTMEKGVYLELIDRIEWEINIPKDEFGSPITFNKLAEEIGLNFRTLKKIITSLEDKGFIKVIGASNKKAIYLYSKYVWFGFEKNRNDDVLNRFLEGENIESVARKKPDLIDYNQKSYCTECNTDNEEPFTSRSTGGFISEAQADLAEFESYLPKT